MSFRPLLLAVAVVALPISARAASTITPANPHSYGANIGWMNWRASTADGVEIGEYVCSGYIYGANVGWIHMGDGTPTNNIQYSNTAATDFGVNYSIDPAQPGMAILRGYAYGANIGWINFESTGNPRLRFSDGNFEGYAYSANCGWINLGNGAFTLSTDSVSPGIDTDSDGMADAFEFQFFGNLAMNQTTDTDGDGVSDANEYAQGTNPTSPTDRLRITLFTTNPGGTAIPAWVSSPSEPPLPPTVGRSAMPTSLNQATAVTRSLASVLRQAQHERIWILKVCPFVLSLSKDVSRHSRSSRVFQNRLVLEDRHHAAPAIDANALAVLDPLGRLAGADHRGEAVFARDDRHVAHRAADVADRGADLLEDRAPGRVGHLAHEDVALLDAADLGDRLDHPRRAFDHPVAGGEALELVGVGVGALVEPGIEVVAGDAPQHDDRRVVDHVGHRAGGQVGG